MREVTLEQVHVGDLIFLSWNDASMDVGKLPDDDSVAALMRTVGIFLGVRGRKHKHLLLGRSKVPIPQFWEADRIPVQLIDQIFLLIPKFLQKVLPDTTLELKKIKLHVAKHNWPLVRVRNEKS